MRPELAMQRGAPHAEKDAQTPACPSWVSRAAIGAPVVTGDGLDQVLECALVARLLALVQG